MINTVRFPQLSLAFICGVVAKNEFVKESKEILQMLFGAIASSNGLSGFPSRSDSSRVIGPKEVYVFKWNVIGQNIMKYLNFYRSFLFDIELNEIQSISIAKYNLLGLDDRLNISGVWRMASGVSRKSE